MSAALRRSSRLKDKPRPKYIFDQEDVTDEEEDVVVVTPPTSSKKRSIHSISATPAPATAPAPAAAPATVPAPAAAPAKRTKPSALRVCKQPLLVSDLKEGTVLASMRLDRVEKPHTYWNGIPAIQVRSLVPNDKCPDLNFTHSMVDTFTCSDAFHKTFSLNRKGMQSLATILMRKVPFYVRWTSKVKPADLRHRILDMDKDKLASIRVADAEELLRGPEKTATAAIFKCLGDDGYWHIESIKSDGSRDAIKLVDPRTIIEVRVYGNKFEYESSGHSSVEFDDS